MLVLIPACGTRWTFIFFALLLLAVVAAGFLLLRRFRWAAGAALLGVALAALGWWRSGAPVKPGAHVLFEGESAYQYVRVVENNAGWRLLQLNEGVVTHSKYHPRQPLTFGEWDYFAVAPLFSPTAAPVVAARRWALIGAGAGTTARLVHRLYGDVRIDGVEPDPLVAEVGERFFGERPPGYHVTLLDGRAWLLLNHETYDVIGIDAYRQPYIPFELTTVECFQQVRSHLSENGVVAINVVHIGDDDRLAAALAATLRQVFPSVYVLHLPARCRTSILVATCGRGTVDDFQRNRTGTDGLLRLLAGQAEGLLVTNVRPGLVLTDDRAPVERLMDLMLFRYVSDGSGGT